ncbi:hypothetical protein I6M39_02850 [Shewanella algae]|uniref:hypothetical protein n=1 Tax=Shewanella algae TaxID=38313 RepID=UPI001AACDAFE|nr:hypothetical protein [Shewanella algae]MBO2567943.1 hypothetical protein [Shewanella algae]
MLGLDIAVRTRSTIAIWLAAILVLLSVAASAHSISHLEEGHKTHCTLCFHQHQLNKLMPGTGLHLDAIKQSYIRVSFTAPSWQATHVRLFNSRAPPVTD